MSATLEAPPAALPLPSTSSSTRGSPCTCSHPPGTVPPRPPAHRFIFCHYCGDPCTLSSISVSPAVPSPHSGCPPSEHHPPPKGTVTGASPRARAGSPLQSPPECVTNAACAMQWPACAHMSSSSAGLPRCTQQSCSPLAAASPPSQSPQQLGMPPGHSLPPGGSPSPLLSPPICTIPGVALGQRDGVLRSLPDPIAGCPLPSPPGKMLPGAQAAFPENAPLALGRIETSGR